MYAKLADATAHLGPRSCAAAAAAPRASKASVKRGRGAGDQ